MTLNLKAYAIEASNLAIDISGVHAESPKSIQPDLEKAVAHLIAAKSLMYRAHEKLDAMKLEEAG